MIVKCHYGIALCCVSVSYSTLLAHGGTQKPLGLFDMFVRVLSRLCLEFICCIYQFHVLCA